MNQCLALIALNQVKGLGPILITRLLKSFRAEAIWQANQQELLQVQGIGPKILQGMNKVDWNQVKQEYQEAKTSEISLTPHNAANYPRMLKAIYDPPSLLYMKGSWNLQDNEKAIAIVGTRKATPYGLHNAYQLARELARNEITIVSGLARGIDIAAHRGALSARGRTIAVLGSGIKQIYPSQHKQDAINIAKNGAVISEYPLHCSPKPENFPRRNRIISGLSLGTIVIEAKIKSGAMITAYRALEQGREVFAIPGDIDRETSHGPHHLIQQGAKLIRNLDDIFEEIKCLQHKSTNAASLRNQPADLDEQEAIIWKQLRLYPQTIENIIQQAGLPAAIVANKLILMELKELITAFPGQRYAKRT